MLIAGRMLSDSSKAQIVAVPATLVKCVSYTRWDGAEITAEIGTPISVDIVNGIALIGDDHVTVGDDDYTVDFPN
jgi:hypothetical protein